MTNKDSVPEKHRAEAALRRYCEEGHPEDLLVVLQECDESLLRIARGQTRSWADADDVLQETITALMESRHNYDPAQPALPWLTGILVNKVHRIREKYHKHARAPVHKEVTVGDPADIAARSELASRVMAVCAELGDIYAPVLHLHLHEGLDAKSIAARLDRPAGTVRTQLIRAMDLVRKRVPEGAIGSLFPWLGPIPESSRLALGALRERVASTVAAPVAVGTFGGLLFSFGTLLMTKTSITTLSACGLALLLWCTGLLPLSDKQRMGGESSDRSVAALSTEADNTRGPLSGNQRAAVAESTSPYGNAQTGSVKVDVRHGADKSPVAHVGVYARKGEEVRSAATKSDGTAQIQHLAPGQWVVTNGLSLSGNAVVAVDVRADSESHVAFSIDEIVIVRGRVVDELEVPVEGAAIWVSQATFSDGIPYRGQEVCESDSTGSFTVPVGTVKNLIGARKQGFSPSRLVDSMSIAISAGSRNVAIILHRGGGVLSGVVTKRNGLPAQYAQVGIAMTFTPWNSLAAPLLQALPQVQWLVSDEMGGFAALVHEGAYSVTAWASGCTAHAMVSVVSGSGTNCALVVDEPAIVSGVVRDSHNQAVTGCRIDARHSRSEESDMSGFSEPTAVSDEYGRFSLEVFVHDGEVMMEAWADAAYVRSSLSIYPGARVTWNPVLPDSLDIGGRVIDVNGTPIANVQVCAGLSSKCFTDSNGRFLCKKCGCEPTTVEILAGVDIERETVTYGLGNKTLKARFGGVWRQISAANGLLHREHGVVPGNEDVTIIVDDTPLTNPARIHGKIVGMAQCKKCHVKGRMIGDQCESFMCEVSNDSGEFDLECTGVSAIELALAADDMVFPLGAFSVLPGQRLDIGKCLLPRSGGLNVSLSMGGRPCAVGAVVVHRPGVFGGNDGEDNVAIIIENGKGILERLAPGKVWLTATYGGECQSIAVEVVSGSMTTASLELQPALEAHVIVDASNAPFPGGELSLRSTTGPTAYRTRLYVDSNAKMTEIVSIPAGRYVAEFRATDGRICAGELLLATGKEQLTLTLPGAK